MEKNLFIAGFGGQGIMLMGKLLSYSSFSHSDSNVTFFPSYGAEQRGGTANCYVVISDEEIGSPLGDSMDDLIIMNAPSLCKFQNKLISGGNLFLNSSLTSDIEIRNDVNLVAVPVTEMASNLGNVRVANIIMLGVYAGFTEILPIEAIRLTLCEQLKAKANYLSINEEALNLGAEIGRKKKMDRLL